MSWILSSVLRIKSSWLLIGPRETGDWVTWFVGSGTGGGKCWLVEQRRANSDASNGHLPPY